MLGRKPRWYIIGSHIYDNWRHRARFRRGNFDAEEGATHRHWPIARSLEYIRGVFEEYLSYGGLDRGDLEEKTILELGPGDNLGVALTFLAHGARRVIALDKVRSIRNTGREREIYVALRQQFSGIQRERFDAALDLASEGINLNTDYARYVHGVGIEDAGKLLPDGSVDLIVSRAVLMEIHEIDRALETMGKVLRPGGRMIHQIAPCHDYGMFTQNGYHPLEYLAVPDWLYHRMTCDSGKPNRRLLGYYRDAMARLGYSARLHITAVIGLDRPPFPPDTLDIKPGVHYSDDTLSLVRAIRPRLEKQFRSASDEDLMIESAFLVAARHTS